MVQRLAFESDPTAETADPYQKGLTLEQKHSQLKDTKISDVDLPDFCFLCYAVCAGKKNSCGWGGWLLDGTFKSSDVQFNKKVFGRVLPNVSMQICPNCRGELYRTDAYVRMNFQEVVKNC